jgi:hypothetical protein
MFPCLLFIHQQKATFTSPVDYPQIFWRQANQVRCHPPPEVNQVSDYFHFVTFNSDYFAMP